MTDSRWSASTGEAEEREASFAISGKPKDVAATISSGKSAQEEREAKRKVREEQEKAEKEREWKERQDREREKDKQKT
ncbi:hypothetical protein G7Y89_g10558 [Cudoniella acicularis]|uniref:Uncharacterized protein n=1 Tax=Cudoniella acicularis TaxID=354080 RepID=A0A8H4VYX1_9HELO|nr:hypothetical protein G7Y89_g10558 [Cudoniella acicularis]